MKTTRSSTFETNSSSSHSIVMNGHNTFSTLFVDENGTIHIPRLEFGWGFERYSDALSKAAYAIQSVSGSDYAGPDTEKLEIVQEVILEHTGGTKIEMVGEGYIDHQSTETFIDSMPATCNFKQWCKEFIFGSYTLIIDNDNH